MPVERSWAVETRGIGFPDYTREVSSARARPGISLKYLENLAVHGLVLTDRVAHPSPVPWVKPPLAPGGEIHLVDFSTGDATPYATLGGYALQVMQEAWSWSEDVEIWLYFDTVLLGCFGIGASGCDHLIIPVYTYNTLTLDPTAASPHTYDVVVVNRGLGNLEGAIDIASILTAIGTPPLPNVKDCRCPFCNHMQTVPVSTTNIVCEKCSKPYIVYDFSKIRKF